MSKKLFARGLNLSTNSGSSQFVQTATPMTLNVKQNTGMVLGSVLSGSTGIQNNKLDSAVQAPYLTTGGAVAEFGPAWNSVGPYMDNPGSTGGPTDPRYDATTPRDIDNTRVNQMLDYMTDQGKTPTNDWQDKRLTAINSDYQKYGTPVSFADPNSTQGNTLSILPGQNVNDWVQSYLQNDAPTTPGDPLFNTAHNPNADARMATYTPAMIQSLTAAATAAQQSVST